MLVLTTWKARPLSPEQANRMMTAWGKLEAKMAEDSNLERLGWYIHSDGSGGVEIVKASDPDKAAAFELEASLTLGEFLELESKVVLDMDAAMPAIMNGMAAING